MYVSYCKAVLSGIEISYAFRYSDTANYLGKYIIADIGELDNCVSLSDYEIKEWKKFGNEVNGFAEYSLLHCLLLPIFCIIIVLFFIRLHLF